MKHLNLVVITLLLYPIICYLKDAGISTGCDCGVKRGKLSLILQGISYAIEQIKRGQIWFKDILASSEEVPSFIQEFPNVDELFDPDSSSDSELSVDFNFDDEH